MILQRKINMLRPDGGESCNIFWTMNITSTGLVNEQTAFTFYSFIFGFAGIIKTLKGLCIIKTLKGLCIIKTLKGLCII